MKMFSYKNFTSLLLAVLVLILLVGCKGPLKNNILGQPQTTLDTTAELVQSTKIPTEVTVWVHGTALVPQIMPNFFYRKQGFHSALIYEGRYHLRKIVNSLHAQAPELFPLEHFYIFGWNGKLNFEERRKAAQELYYELMNLHDLYREKCGVAPRIKMITHSHGGNVALNLAKVKEKNQDFVISELIMLACPVQAETMHLVSDPLFKKIYSFYSESDLIQIIDPQGLYHNKMTAHGLFSSRLFPQYSHVCQIKSRLGNRGLAHIDFLLMRFISNMPAIMKELAQRQKTDQSGFYALSIPTRKNGPFHRRKVNKFTLACEQLPQSPRHQCAQTLAARQPCPSGVAC